MDGKGMLVVLAGLATVFCIAVAGLAGWVDSRVSPTYGQEIGMVQPLGFLPDRDAHYAGNVNVPNSEANVNNAESHLLNAQATAVIIDSWQMDPEFQKSAGRAEGFWTGFMGILLFVVLFGGVVVAGLIKAFGGG